MDDAAGWRRDVLVSSAIQVSRGESRFLPPDPELGDEAYEELFSFNVIDIVMFAFASGFLLNVPVALADAIKAKAPFRDTYWDGGELPEDAA